ncbi:MAG: ATP-binding protein [Verrucomicrobiota bacterium]
MAKILIVDDYPANRSFLVTLLGYGGHELIEAGDGREALEKVWAESPALVVTDVLMPTMDGFEFVRQLRSEPRIAATPVIFCTACYLEREARNLAAACGVTHVIPKPSEPELVLRVVAEALGEAAASSPSAPPADFDREHLQLVMDKLSRNTDELAAANHKLTELIEINMQLTSERDPRNLLEKVAQSARELTGAKYAVVGLGGGQHGTLERFATSGMDEATASALDLPAFCEICSGMLSKEAAGCRLSLHRGDLPGECFPGSHPPVYSFLGVAITSQEHHYGCIWLTNKLGSEEFDAADEKLIGLLAAQVGRIYENRSLYRQLKRHTVMLDAEIAERKLAEAVIRKLNSELEHRVAVRTAELEATNKELESFTYSVSHDLRAPLRAMNGFSRILLDDMAEQLSEKAKRYLDLIYKNSVQMGQLVSDLLAFSRLGRQELRKQRVAPENLVRECWASLNEEQRDRQIELEIRELPECEADHALLRQVWFNLLSNALKYSRGRLPARIQVGFGEHSGKAAYYVKDNGAGFDMQYAEKLFGVFQRLHTAEEYEGTGVGLAIVQRIVERHGGEVWADALVGEGAAFYFKI